MNVLIDPLNGRIATYDYLGSYRQWQFSQTVLTIHLT